VIAHAVHDGGVAPDTSLAVRGLRVLEDGVPGRAPVGGEPDPIPIPTVVLEAATALAGSVGSKVTAVSFWGNGGSQSVFICTFSSEEAEALGPRALCWVAGFIAAAISRARNPFEIPRGNSRCAEPKGAARPRSRSIRTRRALRRASRSRLRHGADEAWLVPPPPSPGRSGGGVSYLRRESIS
jgi:hypothetical protein